MQYEKFMVTHRVCIWHVFFMLWPSLIDPRGVVTQLKICPGPRFSCMSPLQVSSNRTVIFQNIVVDGFVQKSGIPKSTSPKSINIPFPSHSHPFPHVSRPIRATSTDHLDTPHFCGLFTLGAERPSCASTDGKSLWMMDVSIKHTTKISVILSIHQYILLYNIHDNKIYNNDTTMTIVCSGSMYIKRESLTLVTNRIMDPRDPQRRSASFHVL